MPAAVWKSGPMYACACVCEHVCMCACVCMRACVRMCMCASVRVCVYVCVSLNLSLNLNLDPCEQWATPFQATQREHPPTKIPASSIGDQLRACGAVR